MQSRTLRNVCVFCGSRSGADPAFERGAVAMGEAIADRGLTLVYGGGKVGLMGALANAALARGGRVIGVLPRGLRSREIVHDALTELYLTDSMHERKNRMIELSDAFVGLPGGFGTYDELFETITLAQIGFHDRPNGLLNVAGYFDPFVALLRHTVANVFASPEHERLVVVADQPRALLDALEAWTPPRVVSPRWSVRPPSDPGSESGGVS